MSKHGGALRTAREAAGFSLMDMSRMTNYSKPHLGQLETGRRTVKQEHIAAYESVLGVRIGSPEHTADTADVELLGQAADLVTSIGLRHGGIQAAELAAAQWKWATGLLDQSMTDAVRASLSEQAARLADRLAWSLADSGRVDRAVKTYGTALEIAPDGTDVHAVVRVDLANHYTATGSPRRSLDLLDTLAGLPPVLEFTANGARARAWAMLGEWDETIRHVGLADEAHERVEPDELPDTHRPYLSGRAAHPHRDAGKSLHQLAVSGHHKAVPLAVERLEHAVRLFGPDRARAVAKCEARLRALAG